MTRYEISVPGKYEINIFDTTGKLHKSLKTYAGEAVIYIYMLNAKNLSGGVYFYQLDREGINEVTTKKMVLLK